MHNIDLILTLTAGLSIALVLGYITHRLGLSPIVGYLLAGIAVGPYTPGFVANRELAEQLAEIGVILLMFGVGLHFHFKELLAVKRVAIPGAIVQSLAATVLVAAATQIFDWNWAAGIVLGLSISVASTVVLIRVLADNRELYTRTGHIAVGWLVVEDLLTVVVLVLLPPLFGTQYAQPTHLLWTLGFVILKIAALVIFTLVVGRRMLPWLLEHVAATRSRELFTLTILVLALGVAVGSTLLFGVSMALGAFLAGMVVGRSDFSLRAASEALPMRDAFAVLFFVSVGMLLDPRYLIEAPGLSGIVLAVVLLGKPLAALCIVLLLKYPLRTALIVATALAQIGEFSFMLATLGRDLNILTPAATNAVVTAAIISITLNPLLFRLVESWETRLSRRSRIAGWLNARARKQLSPEHASESGGSLMSDPRYQTVVVGYGPVGQTVARLLQENNIQPTIIDLNLETVRRVRKQGISAIYGDASHLDVLKSAGVEQAHSLILSADGIRNNKEMIRMAHELNPAVRILARSAYVNELPALHRAGAESVFSNEAEIALALTEEILRGLGATPEQIDRERERVHAELVNQFGRT